ncbi:MULTISPECIES: flavin reductase family protein [unclassified Achromobacter]|uniref:flavin reductase family protein n=1 Tax=unclassified Achromobacter TaxID=2626865 RepID=UPI000B51E3B9|nr:MULTISPECIES: flavin reductase family protein [unclassified Achromobacter]OWT77385.1 flavin reductase [Achromobacter sp. HZ28]OWT78266.1 flavin reductase [Achromobacter sp. HZ34]
MHVTAHPSILYFGTPVALLSTVNEDGSINLAPMSSVFWIGWRCYLGLQSISKTVENMRRNGELVINLPSPAQVEAVDRLARTTGSDPVPQDKVKRGYYHVKDKFAAAGLTAVAAETVAPPRVAECPVQLEAVFEHEHSYDQDGPLNGYVAVLEARIKRVHVDESILMAGNPNRIDPDKWRPLIMSFQEFYGLGPKLHPSRLGEIAEELYRTPDFERAQAALLAT